MQVVVEKQIGRGDAPFAKDDLKLHIVILKMNTHFSRRVEKLEAILERRVGAFVLGLNAEPPRLEKREPLLGLREKPGANAHVLPNVRDEPRSPRARTEFRAGLS